MPETTPKEQAVESLAEEGFVNPDEKEIQGFLDESVPDESPTTISNATVIEDVIPDMEGRLDKISEAGAFIDREGVERFADGATVPTQDEDQKFLDNLSQFNKKFGRAPNDASGVKKTEGGGIDTTGAFDEEGKISGGGVTQPQTQAEIEVDEAEREQDQLLADMKKNLDTQTKTYIDSVEQQYVVRRAQLKEINRRASEAINQSLLIGGSSRFAPISSTGIQQAKETSSLLAISQLDAEEKSLINEARQAQITGDFKLLATKLELAEGKRKEKLAEAKALNETIAEENERIKDRAVQISREATILDLFDQGLTEPADIFNAINIDEEGNIVGDITTEEISTVLDRVTTEEIKDAGNQFVKNDLTGQTELRSKTTGEVVKAFGGFKPSNTGGNRDDLSAFQILEARNLAIQIMGKRAGTKPEGYGLVEDLMARGMTADEIGDKLRFSGQSEQFAGDFKSAFEFITKKGFSPGDRAASKDGLDELLEDGDTVGAREFVLGMARDKADVDIRKRVDGRDDLLVALDSLEAGLKALKDQGIDTGFIAGLKEKTLEAGGFEVGNAEQNAIANEIAIAVINYRSAVSGAAFSESEEKSYNKVFPSTGRTTALNQAKINSIRKVSNNAQDAFYRRTIGTSYDAIIGNEPEKPEIKEPVSLEAAQPGDTVINIENGEEVLYKVAPDGTFEII
jgi:hypothetical protein